MGTLRIHGMIDIVQFWPIGTSDADTTKIKLVVGENSFEYKADGETVFSVTNVFDDAISKGQGSTPVIKTAKKDGIKTITVRLQGVDAPELHYTAAPLKKPKGRQETDIEKDNRTNFNAINEERRQSFAESATAALTKYLKKFTNKEGLIPAVFESNIEKPFEVVDTYGRFIGNIYVGENSDINLWLVENGWGQPAFYTSMTIDEMEKYTNAWKKGKKKLGRTGASSSLDANIFDWELLYRKSSTVKNFTIGSDGGLVLMPKIFRRQSSWMVAKRAGALPNNVNFHNYLKDNPDQLILFSELLNQGIHSAKVYSLHDFIDNNNMVLKKPEELVFREKPGTLVNANGNKITKWN